MNFLSIFASLQLHSTIFITQWSHQFFEDQAVVNRKLTEVDYLLLVSTGYCLISEEDPGFNSIYITYSFEAQNERRSIYEGFRLP